MAITTHGSRDPTKVTEPDSDPHHESGFDSNECLPRRDPLRIPPRAEQRDLNPLGTEGRSRSSSKADLSAAGTCFENDPGSNESALIVTSARQA